MEKINILNIPFDNVTMDEAVDRCKQFLNDDKTCYVCTPNAEIVYQCKEDNIARAAVCGADMIIPDGGGVVLGSKMIKTPLKEKVAGVILGEKILPYCAESGKKLFILGAKPGVAESAAKNLSEKYKNLIVCGTKDGYYKDESTVIEEINAAQPDLLYVCLGCPKQEIFMYKYKNLLNVKLMIGLGGSVDIYAGNVQQTPRFFVKANLEWFYRLCKQPSRFGRMMRIPKFFLALKKQTNH